MISPAELSKRFSLGPDVVPVSADEQRELQSQMRLIQTNGGPSSDTAVEFGWWEQLFDKRSKVSGVGELIGKYLVKEHQDRLEEYNDLQIEDGLDEGDGEAAELLLTAEHCGRSSSIGRSTHE